MHPDTSEKCERSARDHMDDGCAESERHLLVGEDPTTRAGAEKPLDEAPDHLDSPDADEYTVTRTEVKWNGI